MKLMEVHILHDDDACDRSNGRDDYECETCYVSKLIYLSDPSSNNQVSPCVEALALVYECV